MSTVPSNPVDVIPSNVAAVSVSCVEVPPSQSSELSQFLLL